MQSPDSFSALCCDWINPYTEKDISKAFCTTVARTFKSAVRKMREVILINYSEYKQLKDIERKYHEASGQEGKGIEEEFKKIEGLEEAQQIEDRKNKDELKTPHAEIDPAVTETLENRATEKSDGQSSFDPLKKIKKKFRKRADFILLSLKDDKGTTWDQEGNLTIDNKEVGGKIQDLLPSLLYGEWSTPEEGILVGKVKSLGLSKLVKSVHKHDKTWYYIGE